MKFWKMNGAGNDFIIINNIEEKIAPERFSAIAGKVCDRHFSVGADGLMIVECSDEADFRMIFYNSDGSIGEMCGNGARCICRYGYENGLSGETQLIETGAGIVTGKRISEDLYRVRLNDPSHIELKKALTAELGEDPSGGCCKLELDAGYVLLGSPGLPHVVTEYHGRLAEYCGAEHLIDADTDRLKKIGRLLRFNSALPKGANVNFYEIAGPDEVIQRTYERGVEDFTYACGTGAGSAVLVLTLLGKVSGNGVKVMMPGGTLIIDIVGTPGSDSGAARQSVVRDIFLTGPADIAAKGELIG